MTRLITFLCVALGCLAGGWYLWDRYPVLQEFLEDKIRSAEFRTLEVRFTAEEIMEKHQKALIKGPGHVFLEPRLLFYPYVLMNTKYSTDSAATQEGVLLWGLTDGEMVINTGTWERTHGYEDCLIAHATSTDFKIIKAIVESGGAINREQLYQRFKSEGDHVDQWLGQCRDKKLVVNSGNRFRLHLQKPKLENLPVTLINEPLVAKPTKQCLKSKKHYSIQQICKLAEMAFGTDFAIRKTEQVYLPVYSIGIQNPDGSVLVTYWNALNGKRFETGE